MQVVTTIALIPLLLLCAFGMVILMGIFHMILGTPERRRFWSRTLIWGLVIGGVVMLARQSPAVSGVLREAVHVPGKVIRMSHIDQVAPVMVSTSWWHVLLIGGGLLLLFLTRRKRKKVVIPELKVPEFQQTHTTYSRGSSWAGPVLILTALGVGGSLWYVNSHREVSIRNQMLALEHEEARIADAKMERRTVVRDQRLAKSIVERLASGEMSVEEAFKLGISQDKNSNTKPDKNLVATSLIKGSEGTYRWTVESAKIRATREAALADALDVARTQLLDLLKPVFPDARWSKPMDELLSKQIKRSSDFRTQRFEDLSDEPVGDLELANTPVYVAQIDLEVSPHTRTELVHLAQLQVAHGRQWTAVQGLAGGTVVLLFLAGVCKLLPRRKATIVPHDPITQSYTPKSPDRHISNKRSEPLAAVGIACINGKKTKCWTLGTVPVLLIAGAVTALILFMS